MGHEWKIGDWAECRGARYLVVKAWSRGDCQFVNAYSGSGAVRTFSIGASNIKHLPECTGWEWEPPKPVEPTARKWEFGDWADSPVGIIRFIAYHGDMWFLCADGLVRPLEGRNAIYLPDCTGFDWTPPSPVKQIEPPSGYRLMTDDEIICPGDMFLKNCKWINTGIGTHSITCAVGEALSKYDVTAYARKIDPRYRPFANAAEFAPHKNRWLRSDDNLFRIGSFTNRHAWPACASVGTTFVEAFQAWKFEDGTPFGVLETKE